MDVHGLVVRLADFIREYGTTPLREAFDRYAAARLAREAADYNDARRLADYGEEHRVESRDERWRRRLGDDFDGEIVSVSMEMPEPFDRRNVLVLSEFMTDDEALARLAALRDVNRETPILPPDALKGAGGISLLLREDAKKLDSDDYPDDVKRLAEVLERVGKRLAKDRESARLSPVVDDGLLEPADAVLSVPEICVRFGFLGGNRVFPDQESPGILAEERAATAPAGDAKPPARKSRRGRKPKYDSAADDKLYTDWESSGLSVPKFAAARGRPLADTRKAYDRARRRKSRAETAGR